MNTYPSNFQSQQSQVIISDIESDPLSGNIEINPTNSQQSSRNNMLSNLQNKVKGYLNTSVNESRDIETEAIENTSDWIQKVGKYFEIERNYTKFFTWFTIGIGLVFFSFLFLPMVLFSPQKFVSLFSIGSCTTIFSFIFYYGTFDFISMLFNKERKVYTVLFICSIVLGIYLAFNPTYLLISLICSAIQMFVMIMFTLSFIPGGSSGISLMVNMVMAPVKNMLSK